MAALFRIVALVSDRRKIDANDPERPHWDKLWSIICRNNLAMRSVLGGIVGGLLFFGGFLVIDQTWKWFPAPEDNTQSAHWASSELRDLLLDIEVYRSVFGFYPKSLKQARGGYGGTDSGAQGCDCRGDYVFSLMEDGNSYLLFSVGPDCAANTKDDLFPFVTTVEQQAIGYRKRPQTVAQTLTEACTIETG